MMRRRLLLSLGFAAILALPACGPAPRSTQVKSAPPFDLPDLNGGRVTLGSLEGKVLVVDFWATWCGPCIHEIPQYSEFWRKNQGRGIEVLGIVMDSGDPDEILDFVREHRIPYRQLLGDDDTASAFGVNQGYPTTFVIDAKGRILSKVLGSPPTKFKKLQEDVDAALAG
jgi:peroxiredoxin